jgi:hypothetical protein
MWKKLTELTQEDYRFLAELRNESTFLLAEVVRLTTEQSFASHLAAVTSLGHLRLSSCLTYGEMHHHWSYPSISLSLTDEGKIRLYYDAGGEPGKEEKGFQRDVDSLADAVSQIERFMIRMPEDTSRIDAEIQQSIERKRALEQQSSD